MEKDLSLETNERFVNVFQWTDFNGHLENIKCYFH